jgi:hypothetical protein
MLIGGFILLFPGVAYPLLMAPLLALVLGDVMILFGLLNSIELLFYSRFY